jgi:hypothetical protein
VRAEVVGELFDNEVGHDRIHLLGEQHFTPKPLICINKSAFFAMKSRIQDHVKNLVFLNIYVN